MDKRADENVKADLTFSKHWFFGFVLDKIGKRNTFQHF